MDVDRRRLLPGEGVEDQAGSHPEKADQEGEVIGLCRTGISRSGKGFNHFSQKRHEEGGSRHRKKIDEAGHGS